VTRGGGPGYTHADAQSVQQPIAPKDGPSALALLNKVIAAKGGLEHLRGIKSITATTQATNLGPNAQAGTLETLTYLVYPNRVRVESKNDREAQLQIYDGVHAWVKDASGIHDVPEPMVRNLEGNLRRDTITALIAAANGQVHTRLLLDSKDEAGALRYAIEFSGPNLDPMVLYIDPTTHLVVGQTYVTGKGAGGPVVEELFSDYRPIDGVQIAFTTRVRVRGELVLERRVTSLKINSPIDPALFTRPAS
jgi:hypothetical protein